MWMGFGIDFGIFMFFVVEGNDDIVVVIGDFC